MCGQTAMVLVFAFVTVVNVNGDVEWVALLTVLTGLCGMCFGEFLFAFPMTVMPVIIC